MRLDNAIDGYGIIDKKAGDIPQIGVNKKYRGLRIGQTILTDLIINTEANKINIINVDDQCTTLKNFLCKLGFNLYVNQYEMTLNIDL